MRYNLRRSWLGWRLEQVGLVLCLESWAKHLAALAKCGLGSSIMSDSDFGAVSLFAGFLDITDEAWTTANLSDDEIDLPEGHDVVVDDGEVDLGESIEAAEQEELKWTDKGIDLLLQREGGAAATSN